MAWTQKFYDPIPLPDGRQLVTLRDAAHYLSSVAGNRADLEAHWVTALEAVLLVGKHGGDPMLPRIAMMQALYRGPVVRAPRAKRAKTYRVIS